MAVAFGYTYLGQLALAPWRSGVLFALSKLMVFDILESGPRSGAEVATTLDVPAAGMYSLLNAGVALKLLNLTEGMYENSVIAQRHLAPGSAEPLSNWIRLMARWSEYCGTLDVLLRKGEQIEPRSRRLGEDPTSTEEFILGIHEHALMHMDEFLLRVDANACRTLIDVGGGGGSYSIALCEANPQLRARVLDLPGTLPVARRLIAAKGLAARIEAAPCDYHVDDFGGGADIALLSQILHQEPRHVCRSILARAHRALDQDGMVVVQGHFLNDDRASPAFATLHDLATMALWHAEGSYTVSEIESMLEEAGFRDISAEFMASSVCYLITGKKTKRD